MGNLQVIDFLCETLRPLRLCGEAFRLNYVVGLPELRTRARLVFVRLQAICGNGLNRVETQLKIFLRSKPCPLPFEFIKPAVPKS
jgi:hypothetical protein